MKHGLLAREVLLASENARDLDDLVRRLHAALRPADDLEAFLVDRVVTCAWRLRRALRAEAAEIDRTQAAVLRRAEDESLPPIAGSSDEDFFATWLRVAEENVAWLKAGGDPFEEHLNEEDDSLVDALELLAEAEFPGLVSEDDDVPGRKVRQHVRALGWTTERLRDALVAILENQRRGFKQRATQAQDARSLALHVCAVPRDGTDAPLDRLLRYEVSVERSLFRALHELQRLQAVRGAAALPVPPGVDATPAQR